VPALLKSTSVLEEQAGDRIVPRTVKIKIARRGVGDRDPSFSSDHSPRRSCNAIRAPDRLPDPPDQRRPALLPLIGLVLVFPPRIRRPRDEVLSEGEADCRFARASSAILDDVF
jgi:hypothetical protein